MLRILKPAGPEGNGHGDLEVAIPRRVARAVLGAGVHGNHVRVHVGILLIRITRVMRMLCCASDTVLSSRVVMGPIGAMV